jgi:signal transduction histidine kinase
MRGVFFYLFLFYTGILCAQTNRYLDSILELENKLSEKEFLQTIINIKYDKALTDSKKYLLLGQKAEKIATTINEQALLAQAYKIQSLAYHFSSKFELAVAYTLKSADIFRSLNDLKNYATAYTDLGWKIKRHDLKKALFYMRKGINILEQESTDSDALIAAYNNYGVLQQWSSQLDSAFYYHKKSLDLCLEKKDSIGIPFAQTHMAEVYLKKKQFNLAEELLKKAMAMRVQRKDIYGITDSHLYLGDLYYAKKDFKKAVSHFKKGEKLAFQHHYFPLRKYALEYLFKSYDQLSDAQKTLRYYKLFNHVKDSILNFNTNAKIAELEIRFQTTEKERKIAQQQAQLLENELTIKTRNLYALLLAFALITLAIISFGVYRRNQFKRKQLQKELELKDALATIKTQNRLEEQRLKISRDLHDNIGAQLTFITSSIDNLKYVSKGFNDTFKEKLTAISSFTTDTIFQLRDTIWAMNHGEISYLEFEARIQAFIEKAQKATPGTHFTMTNNVTPSIKLDAVMNINVFRIIQEIINNTLKHAEATEVSIQAMNDAEKLYITIEDNGKGFDKEEVISGYGLQNIKKRAQDIGGFISLTSAIGKGVRVSLNIPLK